MIKTVLFLTALALVQGRPSDDAELNDDRLYEPHPDCPPAEVHFLLPHEYDCTKFYYCEYGLKFIEPRDCAPGTEFNAQIQVCVHPAAAGCTLPGYPTTPAAPTTAAPVTAAPTTAAPVTARPTTAAPITAAPTAAPATTANPDDCGDTLPNGCPADFSIHKLLPHEEFCHKFYYCDKGELVLRYCPVGTYFNPKLEVCDWPHNVDCVNDGSYEYPSPAPPVVNPTTPGGDDCGEILENGCPANFEIHHLLPHESNCNKFYYCVNGETVERDCPAGLHFNPVLQVCDWPNNAGCEPVGGGCGGDNGGGGCVTPGPPDASSEEIPSPSDPEGDWVPLPNGCPANFDIHHLLPHESDCNRFYYCVHGQKVERVCPAGLHFNPVLQICDWPNNAGCAPAGGGGGCTTPGDNGGGGCVTPGGTTPIPSPTVPEGDWVPLPNGCPANFDIHHLLPHESDCNRFYYCVHGQKVERVCPAGLHFNPVLQICDWPNDAGCAPAGGGGGCTTPGDNGGGGCVTPGPPDASSEEISNPSDPEGDWVPLPNGCPANFDIHHLLPHESDCNRFYYCVHGQKVERVCPAGLHFNPVLQICDWPNNAGCAPAGGGGGCTTPGDNGGGGCVTPGGTTPIPSPTVPEGDWVPLPNGCPANFDIHHLLPHESDCNRFYYCVHGQKVERVCPAGLHFNPVLQICDWPNDAGCAPAGGGGGCTTPGDNGGGGCVTPGPPDASSEEISNPSDPEGDWVPLPNGCPANFDIHHLLPHESDCNRFYYCVHGQKVERVCPAGLHFNPVLQICDWPNNAGCAPAGGGGGGCTTPGDNGGGGCVTPGGTTPIPSPTVPEGDWVPLPNGCPANFDIHHLLPHESDCNRFYYCVHGQKVERVCPAGLHFNPVLQICDWPQNAGCESVGGGCTTPGDNGGGGCVTPGGTTPGGPPDDSSEEILIPSDPEGDWVPLPNGCPADFDIHHLLPHESDCNRFYYCVHGQKVERICPAGLHFNPVLQVCDWPQYAGCEQWNGGCTTPGGGGSGGCTTATPGDIVNPTTVAPGNDGTTAGLPGDWVPLPNGCPADFDIHHLLPHENDCNKFYYCVHGQKVERICPAGLHFNPVLQVCDWPQYAGCEQWNGGCNTPGDGGSGGCTTPGNDGTTARPPDSSEEIPSPSDPDDDWVPLPNGCPADFDIHHLLPHEYDCNKFYYCVHGQKVERVCPAGLHFNPVLQVCDWPQYAGCEQWNGGCTTPGGGGSGGCTTPGNDGTTVTPATTGSTPTPATTVTPGNDGTTPAPGCDGTCPINPADRCKNECNVSPWAHDSCDKYWTCNGDRPLLITCSEGLHFNLSTLTCDFICNAGCIRKSVQATALSDGLKIFLPWDKIDQYMMTFLKLD